MNKIIRECDKCKKEDSINSITGLCPSCEEDIIISLFPIEIKGGQKE